MAYFEAAERLAKKRVAFRDDTVDPSGPSSEPDDYRGGGGGGGAASPRLQRAPTPTGTNVPLPGPPGNRFGPAAARGRRPGMLGGARPFR